MAKTVVQNAAGSALWKNLWSLIAAKVVLKFGSTTKIERKRSLVVASIILCCVLISPAMICLSIAIGSLLSSNGKLLHSRSYSYDRKKLTRSEARKSRCQNSTHQLQMSGQNCPLKSREPCTRLCRNWCMPFTVEGLWSLQTRNQPASCVLQCRPSRYQASGRGTLCFDCAKRPKRTRAQQRKTPPTF